MIDSALLELAVEQGRDASIGTAVLSVVCGIDVGLALLMVTLALLTVVLR